MKHMSVLTISQLIPELDKICDELGLEKKVIALRNLPNREHGYLKAYEVWKQRNKKPLSYSLAINAKNRIN
jgi:hypothetical protein